MDMMSSWSPVTSQIAVALRESRAPKATAPEPTCPECGSKFVVQSPTVVEDPTDLYVNGKHPHRQRLARVAFCTGCEYVKEF